MAREITCSVCGGIGRPYARGDWCDDCRPFPAAPIPDPERTLDALAKKRKRFKTYHKYGTNHDIVTKSKWVK